MKPNPSNFYRITNQHSTRSHTTTSPTNQPHPYPYPHQSTTTNNTTNNISPQKLTEQIVRNNKFVYIDINSDHGLCQMEMIDARDADQDVQVFAGKYYLSAVHRLPQETQKVMDYVYKMQEFRKQKQKFKQLLKDQINLTLANRKLKHHNPNPNPKQPYTKNSKTIDDPHPISNPTLSPNPLSKQPTANRQFKYLPRRPRSLSMLSSAPSALTAQPVKNSVVVYRGMQTKYLREYLEQKEMETINAQILEKQKQLIAKYGLTNQFESATKAKSHIVRTHGKVHLPEIKSSSFLHLQ